MSKLKKSLNGLKQPQRQWYKLFDRFMHGRRYKIHFVYFKELHDGSFIYLMFYIDDMLIATTNKVETQRLKEKLSEEFETKCLGEAKNIRSMEIHRHGEHGKGSLTQSSYLRKVLHKFGVGDSKPVSTPLAPYLT